ncbi:hypothetical protein DPX16_9489 [Anabarilius grahami]|uniref:Uncharacterized protein n=1 Tax=Anabarilius grahami TaxID=495550 RepID=A0A3N0Z5N8_ANAGA|nr:hypothetical protein DPX16_9489 [Anabarilius grahami]
MTARGARVNASAWMKRPVAMETSNVSTNPFLMDIRDTNMDLVNNGDGQYADNTNPFAAGMERTLAADGATVYGRMPSFNLASPLTPPPSRLTNPFLMSGGLQNKAVVPEPSLSNQFQHKGVQCNMAGSPAAEDTGETPPEQPPVGVVVPEGSCGSSPAVKPKYLPEGVVDTFSDNLADPSFRPGVYRTPGRQKSISAPLTFGVHPRRQRTLWWGLFQVFSLYHHCRRLHRAATGSLATFPFHWTKPGNNVLVPFRTPLPNVDQGESAELLIGLENGLMTEHICLRSHVNAKCKRIARKKEREACLRELFWSLSFSAIPPIPPSLIDNEL